MSRTLFRVGLVAAVLGLAAPVADAATPIAASDNVDTAIATSKARYPGKANNPVLLTRSDGWTDALSAGAVAGRQGTVVLVNPPGPTLDSRVEAEIGRVTAGGVWIVGGTAAVSAEVEARLRALGHNVSRIAGSDRITTAVAMANNMAVYIDVPHVYLTRAFGDGTAGFADALGGGLLAGHFARPLLVTETDHLSPPTKDFLQARDVTTVTVIGGTAAVSEAVVNELVAMDIEVTRLAGANRFATAEQAARAVFADIDEPATGEYTVVLVDGVHAQSWVAGFAGAAYDDRGAIMLTNGASLPDETRLFLSFVQGQRGAQPNTLLCAPEVSAATCNEADALLNG